MAIGLAVLIADANAMKDRLFFGMFVFNK